MAFNKQQYWKNRKAGKRGQGVAGATLTYVKEMPATHKGQDIKTKVGKDEKILALEFQKRTAKRRANDKAAKLSRRRNRAN